jgi:hypothetical protein
MPELIIRSDLFETANGFLPGGSITRTVQHMNPQVTYTIHNTQIPLSHKISSLKTTNKTKKSK